MVHLIAGILILRFLSIQEYALYTVANSLLIFGSMGSDMKISHGVISLGAPIREDRSQLGKLLATAQHYRSRLYFLSSIVILAIVPFVIPFNQWSFLNIGLSILIVLITNWVQQKMSLGNSILYIHHDSKGLSTSGLATALTRLIAVLFFCASQRLAFVALACNTAGFIAGDLMVANRCRIYIDSKSKERNQEHGKELRDFILPLIPVTIYSLIKGHLNILLLSFFGHTVAVAQVGALGRLAQILGLIAFLNPFFVQPYFSRLKEKSNFISRSLLVISANFLICAAILATAVWFPRVWLFFLGKEYASLDSSVGLAFLSPLFDFIEFTLYTLLISRGLTSKQFWAIPLAISIQLLFLRFHGLYTTQDALYLNAFVSAAGMALQIFLLVQFIQHWKVKGPVDEA